MSLYSKLQGNGPSGFGYGSTAEDVVRKLDLTGRTILLTGCNSGIGEAALSALCSRGATVIASARSLDKAKEACARVVGRSIPVACELSEPSSVRACVKEVSERVQKLDAIICNAGIMALPKLSVKHGLELQFLTNHIGHFILVTGLVDKLTDSGRVVMVSSDAHRGAPREGIQFDNLDGHKGYSGWTAYGQSKLANLLFAKQLARRFQGTTRVASAVHPGVIRTNLGRHMNPFAGLALALASPLVLKSIGEGAATEVWAAVHPDAASLSGAYLSHCNVAKPRTIAEDAALAERLWLESEKLVAGFQQLSAPSGVPNDAPRALH
jgi:NAD(P)-dependent dehydrogenase (short-subunit alcohol dehydrogenase family)